MLTLAGGTDILATTFQLSLESVLNSFRVGLFVVPVVVFSVTRRICMELTRVRPILAAHEHLVVRDDEGGFSVVETPPRTPPQKQPSGRGQ